MGSQDAQDSSLEKESWPSPVADLAERYRSEKAHSLHVTRLALGIFDRVASHLGLEAQDRSLLEIASLIHDIGYADHPANHAAHGADIALKEPIASITNAQRRCLAAILLLDSRKYEKGLDHPMMGTLKCRERAMRIAALLRVADGLDHGRLQDAQIASVRKIYGKLRLTVRTFYRGNIERAQEKADLWERVFRLPVDVVAAEDTDDTDPLFRLVSSSLPLVENARRILQLEYRGIADNRQAALDSDDPEGIHDRRVSIRRFRAGLRLVKDAIPAKAFCPINEGLRVLRDDLGAIRDRDVWLAFLSEKGKQDGAEFAEFTATQQPGEGERRRLIKDRLSDRAYSALSRRIEYLLRTELPRHQPDVRRSFEQTAARRVQRLLRQIARTPQPASPEATEDIHEMRRLFRRARYWADFSAPVLGKPVVRLERRLRRTAGMLGDMHDRAVFLDRLSGGPVDAPAALKEATQAEHLSLWVDFVQYWPKLRKELKRCAKALREA